MPEQTQKQKQSKKQEETTDLEVPVVDETETLQITDELLDEIDSLLEENAEEFVRSYKQKGGQ